MKRLLFFLMTMAAVVSLHAQIVLTISGTVTDFYSGLPVPNKPITIQSDSTGGFIYDTVTYTNASGFYIDYIWLPAGVTSGYFHVFTYDCNNYFVGYSLPYGPGNMSPVQNFQICTTIPCQAGFTYNQLGGYTFQFTDTSTGTTGPWSWHFGDGGISFQQNPIHVYTSPGYYTVSLKIGSSSLPCYDSIQQVIYIADSTSGGCVADFTSYPDTTGITNTIYFIDQSTGNIISWFWNFGDPTSGMNNTSTSQNPIHIFSTPGIYNVCLTVQGSDSLCNDTYCDSIQVNNSPVVCIANFQHQVTGSLLVQFTDLSTGTTGPWNWQFGDGTSSYQQNPLHTYPSEGYYNVTLTIGDSNTTCWDWITQTIYVYDSTAGNCVASFTYFPDSNSTMNMYQFIDQSTGNITSWSWDFGDPASGINNVSSLQNPVHTFSSPGFYTVCLTVQGPDSLCIDSYCEIINVQGQTNCQAQFTNYPDSSNYLQVYFIDLSQGDITSWFWDFGDGTTTTVTFPGNPNVSHTYVNGGTYYVCLTVQGMYQGVICQSTWCAEVIVGNNAPCINYFTYVKNGLSLSFTGHMLNPEPAVFYWEFGDGFTGAGQTIIHQYPQPGIYYVTLTTTTQNPVMCTYTSSQSITVGDSTQWNQIYGQVFAGNFPLENGLAMILSYDTSLNYNPFIDISIIDSMGVYYFPYVPLGDYVVYALPFIPTGYLPTYYGDVLFWEDATVITLGQANNPYDIYLIEAANYLPGPGSISGQIQTGLKSTLIDKVTMILMNEQSQVISFKQVNSDGEFDFSALGYGISYLRAEIAGCQSDKIRVEITTENPNPTVVLTFTGNQILGVERPVPTSNAGIIFPNPVSETAQLSLTLSDPSVVFVELYNSTGQLVFRNTESCTSGISTIKISVGSLANGVYTLKVYTETGMITTQRLLKSR